MADDHDGPDAPGGADVDGDVDADANANADADATEGTYLVTEADDGGMVLRDVDTGQVHALAEPPGPDVEAGDVLEATLVPEPPMDVVWRAVAVEGHRRIPVERSPEPPTRQARDLVADADPGEVTVRERAGKGEVHVLRVPEGRTDDAARDVLEDEATLTRAARMPAVARVEVRAADGVVSVRYLP